jgi:hypothetical protein
MTRYFNKLFDQPIIYYSKYRVLKDDKKTKELHDVMLEDIEHFQDYTKKLRSENTAMKIYVAFSLGVIVSIILKKPVKF